MLLDPNTNDLTFAFYRIGWNFARKGLALPTMTAWIGSPSTKRFAEYDLQRGYEAYLHRQSKRKNHESDSV